MSPLNTLIIAALSWILCTSSVYAADIEIRMVDSSQTEGKLAFEPSFVKAQVNDTIVFNPASKGHNSHSLLVPSGAQSWKSTFDKEFRVKLEKEGVYLFACDAHKDMGMVGVIQVGKAVNMEEARKKAAEESATLMMNKDRFTKAFAQVH